MTHFYLDGKPYYTVKGANGKERPTTLKDAKKVGAVVGVTSIIGQREKPALGIWQQLRLLDIVESYPNLVGKSANWKNTLLAMSNERNSSYSREGNRIHDAIESYFNGEGVDPENEALVYPTVQLLESMYPDALFESEKSFSHAEGFGGCIDLVVHTPIGKVLIDFKTKNKSGLSSKMCGDDYCMQLAAYRRAEGADDVIACMNILISLESPGEIFVHVWSDDQIERSEKMFLALLEFWKLSNKL